MSQVARISSDESRFAQPAWSRGEEVHVLSGSMDPQVTVELRSLGFRTLREHESVQSLTARLRPSMAGCVMLPVRDGLDLSHAADVSVELRRRPGFALVLLMGQDSSEGWVAASGLTTHCYPASLPSSVLARLIASAIDSRRVLEARESELPDTVTITLFEHVEVDGRQVYLGVAERNFLFLLARRPGVVIAKGDAIEAGPRTVLRASACRRRLGQRLGPALAGLLVPQARFEPYRMREPEEVAAVTRGRREGPVRMRVVGRAGVMVVGGGVG